MVTTSCLVSVTGGYSGASKKLCYVEQSFTNVPLREEGIKIKVRGLGGIQRAYASFLSQSFLLFFLFSLHVSLFSKATVQLNC